MAETTGLKKDNGKSRLDLIDPEWIEGTGHVLRFGAQKYSAHNWRGGIAYSRLLGAAYRHLGAINRGEDIDPESGLPHIHHVSCCIMFLSWMMNHRKDLDDRYKYEPVSVQPERSNEACDPRPETSSLDGGLGCVTNPGERSYVPDLSSISRIHVPGTLVRGNELFVGAEKKDSEGF